MAPAKRKRRATGTTAKKRAKIVETSDPDPEPTTSQEWAAECILEERRRGQKIQYLIEWKDIDPATGTRYEPTWEPEENANEELLESWLEDKAKRSAQVQRTAESSPATLSIPTSARRNTVTPCKGASHPALAPAPAPARTTASPHVPIARRGSSLDRIEFDYHSQLATSQPEALQPPSQETDLESSQLFAANSPQSLVGLVLNTQSSAGEATFVPATQETTGTTTQDTDSSVLEDAEEDPGTTEVIEAASPKPSLAASIPETICDTTGEIDSQSQHRQVEPQEIIEISSSSSTSSAPESPAIGAAQCAAQAELGDTEIQSIAQEQNRQSHDAIAGQQSLLSFAELDQSSLANQEGAGRRQDSLKQTSVTGNPDVPPSVHHHQQGGIQTSIVTTKHITDVTGNARPNQGGPDSAITSEANTRANTIASPVPENSAPPAQNENQELAGFGLQVPSTYSSVENTHDSNSSDQRSLACHTENYTGPQEQHAQVVRAESHTSTQNYSDERTLIPPSVEKDWNSRHDSSQETSDEPESSSPSSSGIASPPHSSFGAPGSYLPPRPETPALRISYSMTSEWSAERIERKLREELDRKKAENPFTPTQNRPSYTTPSAASATPDRSNATNSASLSGILNQEADGTRSPSIIPDHSPVPQAPTSLRTIALSQSALLRANKDQQGPTDDVMDENSGTSGSNPLDQNTDSIPAIVTRESKMPEGSSSSDQELSDAEDDEGASLLNDDLQLSVGEYVVPLFIEGRQSDTYTSYVKHNKDMLHGFLSDPKSFSSLSDLEGVLCHLRALETHFDLVYAEAGLTSSDIGASTQIQFAAQFGVENSIKFKFLQRLFQELKAYDKHVMLVIDADNHDLLEILENFCKAESVNYNMPTMGRRAHENNGQSLLSITVFPSDTKEAIVGAADLIICLNGVQDAAQIRRKSWANNPKVDHVPILHLVIPRTVGHIERYLPGSLNMRTRVHTIIASLSQLLGELGSPLNDDTPHADVAAELVAEWFTASPEDRGEWPLVSIGSVKDLVQFQTQFAEASSPAPERTKRPHDDETFDPAKRMRLTPQPQGLEASGESLDNEVTRISDSMPGTAAESSTQLRQQIKQLEQRLQTEREARKAEAAHFREHEAMWTQQQTTHENLTITHRQLHKENEKLQEQLGRVTSNLERLREQNAQLTTEKRSLGEELEQQRATDMLSSDDKTTELTKLRTELSKANEEKARAVRAADSADKMAEYIKEQYRNAQDSAAQAQASIVELEARIEKLQVAASGQPAKLKALHLDRQHDNQSKQIKALRAENAHLRKSLGQREEELQRAKMSGGRMGVGTRATSATPQPKVRSRAASPMGGRLSNLRNG